MGSLNKVILVGRVGQEPAVSYTNGNVCVTRISMATSDRWTDNNGEKKERTEWHRVVAWDKLAETCAEYVRKGNLLLVEGKLQTRDWTDKDGVKRYTTEVHVRNMQFLGGKKDDTAPAPAQEKTQEIADDNVPF